MTLLIKIILVNRKSIGFNKCKYTDILNSSIKNNQEAINDLEDIIEILIILIT